MSQVVNDRFNMVALALAIVPSFQVILGSGLPRDSPMTGFIVWGQVFPPLGNPRVVPSPYPPELE